MVFLLYILVFILLTIPAASLLLLHRRFSFNIPKYCFSALGLSLLFNFILIPVVWSIFASLLGGLEEGSFLATHPLVTAAFQNFLTAFNNVLCALLLFIILRKQIRVYDACAFGITFSYIGIFSTSISVISFARVVNAYNKGTIESLANENYSVDELTDLAKQAIESGISPFLSQLLNELLCLLLMVYICLLLYHCVKTKKWYYALLAFVYNFVVLYILSVSEQYMPVRLLWIPLSISILLTGFLIFLYARWYFKERKKYSEQLAAYKQSLKR